MNSFRRLRISVINTARILGYMKVSFKTFKLSWNTYFLNYLWYTWSHGRHLMDSCIALFSKSWTLPNVYAFILSKLLIMLMGFQRVGVALKPRQIFTAPNARCMLCAMHGMWFLNAGHSIPEASSGDCSSRVIMLFEEALSVVIPSTQPAVSLKQSSTFFKCTGCHAPVCWPLRYHP